MDDMVEKSFEGEILKPNNSSNFNLNKSNLIIIYLFTLNINFITPILI